jgi:hypothetical protein
VIEQIKNLGPELGAVSLLERERLEYREIHVLEARVAEDVPAHVAIGSYVLWSNDGAAGYEAATILGIDSAQGVVWVVDVGALLPQGR